VSAVVVFVLTRIIAFPLLADDVGNWTETLGVLSIVSESLAAAVCLTAAVSGSGRPDAYRSASSAMTSA
jgi:hypothetical protein